MSVVILQDEIVHYEVLGRGKPLIFIHGWVGSWRYWIPSMQAASISFRTYAVDLWGFGDTAKSLDYYSLDQQVNLISLFMEEMGIAKTALIGHGLGAVVAFLFALQNPSLVDRLMTICLPNGQHSIHPKLFTSTLDELADWLLSRTPEKEPARQEVPKTDQRAIQFSLASLQRLDFTNTALTMTTPCLLVYSSNDPVVEAIPTADETTSSPDAQPNMHQIVFEQSGHFPMLDEQPKFNRLLADFLTLSSGTSPRQLQLKEEWVRRVR